MQKRLRLARREDFNKVYRFGKSMANHQFVLYQKTQPAVSQFRMGISVSKKVGNAVVRNRIRRVVKEIVRLRAEEIAPRVDFVLIARKPVATMGYAEIEKSLLHLLRKSGMLVKHKNR
ncbi:ribonuclease P protein component [Paenibacillus sp. y28]|uniref:ribonuclease P protein component n=1 Tax=Paenibacillus sp. y28 TaxID=3129110 RepID=UPI00301630FF